MNAVSIGPSENIVVCPSVADKALTLEALYGVHVDESWHVEVH